MMVPLASISDDQCDGDKADDSYVSSIANETPETSEYILRV